MADPASWDLLDEDCSGILDWTDIDKGTGVSGVYPVGNFRFESKLSAANNDYAGISRVLGSAPDTFTVEIKIWHDPIGILAATDYAEFWFEQADERLQIFFCSDGIFIADTGSGNTEVGTNLVLHGGAGEWQTWRFLVTFGSVGDGVCNVELTDSAHTWEKVGTNIPCSLVNAGDVGKVRMYQTGYTTDDQVSWTDYIKIATGLYSWLDYPDFSQLVGSNADPQSGINIHRASNGDPRSQTLYTADRQNFKIIHDLDVTDKSTLDTFYANTKDKEIALTWKGDYGIGDDVYNCIWMPPGPKYTPIGTGRTSVEVNLAEKD